MSHSAEPLSMMAHRSGPLTGTAQVPGDKSISHRALILGALSVGEIHITGLLEGQDVLFNLAGQTVLEVELVNDSEKKIQKGKEALLSGELDAALAAFREALEMDPDNAHAHLNIGVALKLKGDKDGATKSLEKAKSLDPKGPTGSEADRLLTGLKGVIAKMEAP